MTGDVQRLVFVALFLLVIQWVVVPVIAWQNDRSSALQQDLTTLAARQAIVGSTDGLRTERDQRSGTLAALSQLTFPDGPSATLEVQRWVTASLKSEDLEIKKFEWSPASEGALSIVRAKVDVTGRTDNLMEWIARLQTKDPWVNVLAFQLRRAGRRSQDLDEFSGTLTLQFILQGESLD
ncbi:hypothetical protein N9C20_05020 [Luminiphilus sp.]|nr:hypothetical protein [Luminiphilus sp.]